LMGTPCSRIFIARGAMMNVASSALLMKASFISGKPLNRTGSKGPSPFIWLLMKCVTGQVRCQVTGRKPTRKTSALRGGSRLAIRCRAVMPATQVTMPRRARPFFDMGSLRIHRAADRCLILHAALLIRVHVVLRRVAQPDGVVRRDVPRHLPLVLWTRYG